MATSSQSAGLSALIPVQSRRRSSVPETRQTQFRQAANRSFVLRGLNPVVTGISGNGTRSTTQFRQMHNGGTWEFFSNGAFRFTPRGLGVYARTDLFPVVGRYQIKRNVLSFSGSRTSSNLTARNAVGLAGQISLRSGVANMAQRTVTIMAANVGGIGFGQNIDRTITFNLRMTRIA